MEHKAVENVVAGRKLPGDSAVRVLASGVPAHSIESGGRAGKVDALRSQQPAAQPRI